MEPVSLLGSGMIEEEGDPNEQASLLRSQGTMPTAALMSLMAPPPAANPGLAAGSGVLGSLAGTPHNPYLQQHQQYANSVQAGQQGALRTMGYLQQQQLAAQSQLLQQQRMRMEQEKMKTEQENAKTRANEARVKLFQGMLKGSPAEKKLGALEASKYYKEVQGWDIKPEDIGVEDSLDLKEHQVKDIRSQLQLIPKDAPPEQVDAALENIRGVYNVPKRWLMYQRQVLGNESARIVAGIEPEKDPTEVALKAAAERTKNFLTKEGWKPELYPLASDLFKSITRGPLTPQGRSLATATEEDRSLIDLVRREAEADLERKKILTDKLSSIEVQRNRLAAEARLGKAPQPGTPEFDIELGKRLERLIPVTEGGVLISAKDKTAVYEAPVSPEKLSELRTPGTLDKPPTGSTRSDLTKMGAVHISPESVAAYNSVKQEFAAVRKIIENNKTLFPPSTGDKMRDATNHLLAREAWQRLMTIGGDSDMKVLNVFKGTMPQKVRAFGGNTRIMDSNIERAQTIEAFNVQPGNKETTLKGLETVEMLLSEGFESMGLPRLPGTKKPASPLSPSVAPQPTSPVQSQPQAQQPQQGQQYPEGQRLRGSDGKIYRWKNGKAVPE